MSKGGKTHGPLPPPAFVDAINACNPSRCIVEVPMSFRTQTRSLRSSIVLNNAPISRVLVVGILIFLVSMVDTFRMTSPTSYKYNIDLDRKRFRGGLLFGETTSGDREALQETPSNSMALYIHIPYCRQRCRYCDFAIVPIGEPKGRSLDGFLKMDKAYREALLQELSLVRNTVGRSVTTPSTSSKDTKIRLRSVYFGGGTPSLAPKETLLEIIDALMKNNDYESGSFCLEPDAEITIEIDPGTFSLSKLQSFKDIGFNRLSLGVQSFDDKILESIGRVHRKKDIDESLQMIQQVYGEDNVNYSLDLISGLPGLSLAKWAESLETAVNLTPKPSHLSIYDLQIESGTVFSRWYDEENSNDDNNSDEMDASRTSRTRGASPVKTSVPHVNLPSATESAFMYKYAAGYLRSKGYEHYEISSYARREEGDTMPKSSKRSTHNQIYWEPNSQWYALGLGATSFLGGKRYGRPRKMSDYINWVKQQESAEIPDWLPSQKSSIEDDDDDECEDDDDYLTDVIMTRLRTSDGLDLDWIRHNIPDGETKVKAVLRGANLALDLKLAEHSPRTENRREHLRLLDPDGFIYSNTIISSIFVELDELESI